VRRREGQGVVVIAMDTAEMMAGVVASGRGRGTRAGPREEDPVLPLVVSERFLGFVFSSLDISRSFS